MRDAIASMLGKKDKIELNLELNGIANMVMMLESYDLDEGLKDKFRDQLDCLERYMIELKNAADEGRQSAPWHVVRENRAKFPNNRERR